MKKLLKQFKQQSAAIQLLITFLIWFIVWFLAELFFYVPVFSNEYPTKKAIILKSFIFSIVFTISFDWRLIKQYFSKNAQQ